MRSHRPSGGPLSINLLVLLIAIGAFDFGICLLNWLLHVRRSGSVNSFLELCLLLSIFASLMLILLPAFHLNGLTRRLLRPAGLEPPDR